MLLVIDDFLTEYIQNRLDPVFEEFSELKAKCTSLHMGLSSYMTNSGVSCSVHSSETNRTIDMYWRVLNEVVTHYIAGHHGVEWWMNNNTTVGWHVDKCEYDFWEEGQNRPRMPLLSTIYYNRVEINNPTTGRLLLVDKPGFWESLEDTREIPDLPWEYMTHVRPVANRLVIFSPGIFHCVEPFDGIRQSLAMNYWDERIDLS